VREAGKEEGRDSKVRFKGFTAESQRTQRMRGAPYHAVQGGETSDKIIRRVR
jgi:hypothetical protein